MEHEAAARRSIHTTLHESWLFYYIIFLSASLFTCSGITGLIGKRKVPRLPPPPRSSMSAIYTNRSLPTRALIRLALRNLPLPAPGEAGLESRERGGAGDGVERCLSQVRRARVVLLMQLASTMLIFINIVGTCPSAPGGQPAQSAAADIKQHSRQSLPILESFFYFFFLVLIQCLISLKFKAKTNH